MSSDIQEWVEMQSHLDNWSYRQLCPGQSQKLWILGYDLVDQYLISSSFGHVANVGISVLVHTKTEKFKKQ